MNQQPPKRFNRYLFLFPLSALLYYWACQFFPGAPGYHRLHYSPHRYEATLNDIQSSKASLFADMVLAYRNNHEQAIAIQRAALRFQKDLDHRLLPYWLGTPYDFYGNTQIPGEGKIACGYFVTTVLEDMGIRLDRVALAKMPSEAMIKTLVRKEHIRRYPNHQSLEQLLDDVDKDGKGVYIVGLDTHTGFLINNGKTKQFVHASGRSPWQVVRETASKSEVLSTSAYRVTGHITGDSVFIKRWLRGE